MYKFFGKISLLCVFGWATNVQANEHLSIGTAVDFSQGDYGATTKTDVFATVAQIKYKNTDFSVQLDLPYLVISGANYSISSNSTVATSTSNTQNSTREGFGDATLGMTYNAFYFDKYQLAIDIGFKLKIPTASHHDGLGTGEPDETLQFYAYKGIDDFTLIAGGGYKWLGQSSTVKYRNVANITTGLNYQISNSTSLGSLFDARQSVFPDLDNQAEITLYGTHKLSPSWNSQLYAYKGLTDSSPSFGVGGSINYRFW